MKRARTTVALVWVTVGTAIGCGGRTSQPDADDSTTSTAQCIPGQSLECACADGGSGAQRCNATSTFDDCVCLAPEPGDASLAETTADTEVSTPDSIKAADVSEVTDALEEVLDDGSHDTADAADATLPDATPDALDDAGETDAPSCATTTSIDAIGATTVTAGVGSAPCTIALTGKIEHVAYDPTTDIAYGIDSVNRRLSAIELATGKITYRDVTQVPEAACVDATRSRLFVANSGSSFIDEFSLADLSLVRRIVWPAGRWGGPADTRFKIYCGAKRLYVVDGQWSPGLYTVENLDSCPTVIDHSMSVNSVGALVVSPAEDVLYYWLQSGWSAGWAGTDVYRVDTKTWTTTDHSTLGYPAFLRDPLDTPILWDHSRDWIFAKNRVLDAKNLSKVVFTFTDSGDTSSSAFHNAYALNPTSGRVVSRYDVFGLDDFKSRGKVTSGAANDFFFAKDGRLRALVTSSNQLTCQTVP